MHPKTFCQCAQSQHASDFHSIKLLYQMKTKRGPNDTYDCLPFDRGSFRQKGHRTDRILNIVRAARRGAARSSQQRSVARPVVTLVPPTRSSPISSKWSLNSPIKWRVRSVAVVRIYMCRQSIKRTDSKTTTTTTTWRSRVHPDSRVGDS